MTVLQDIRSNPLTGADAAAASAYMEGLTRLNHFIGDPVARAEAGTARRAPCARGRRTCRDGTYCSACTRSDWRRWAIAPPPRLPDARPWGWSGVTLGRSMRWRM